MDELCAFTSIDVVQLYGMCSEELNQLMGGINRGIWSVILPGQSLENAPLYRMRRLLFIIYRSYFSPLFIFPILLALGVIGSRVKHILFQVIAIILVLAVSAVPLIVWSNAGSVNMLGIAVPFVMTVTVFILNFVKLSPLDYAIIFSCFYYIYRFAGSWGLSRSAFGITMPALYVLLAVLFIYKIRLKKVRGHLFYYWFTCVFTFINGYGTTLFFRRYILQLGQTRATRLEALIVWGVALFVIITANAGIIYAIKRLLGRHFDNINNMGKAYPLIERFFIYNSVGIIIFMAVIHFLSGTITYVRDPLVNIYDLITLFALLLQLSFVIMIFRITWLKDNLQTKAIENQSLAAYSSNLEKNMDDIRHIKHDIKNIFITMGNFVAESGNANMQDFYHKKISPFASDEIMKSDIYGKLAGIGNEQIKAFVYYKISQAVERGISVDLDVLVHSQPREIAMEFIDLVRVLGILMDNAIEECMEIADGVIYIKVSQNSEMTSYMIKNTVRHEIKERGVRPGVSSKGIGRGKGLASAYGVIGKYGCVTLNSYFSDGCFVQNLVVYEGE